MDRRAASMNRIGLLLLGLILVTAGAVGLALGTGLAGDARSREPVLSEATRRFAETNGWYWYAVAAGAVVLALIGIGWLLAQGRRGRSPDLSVEPHTDDGVTRVPAGAATAALAEEIEEYPGVRSVNARLGGTSLEPRLSLSVSCDRTADLSALRAHITDQAIAHLRAALDRDRLPAVVRLKLVPMPAEPRTVE